MLGKCSIFSSFLILKMMSIINNVDCRGTHKEESKIHSKYHCLEQATITILVKMISNASFDICKHTLSFTYVQKTEV